MKKLSLTLFLLTCLFFSYSQVKESSPEKKERDGLVIKRDSLGRITDSSFYAKGRKLAYAEYRYYKNGRPFYYIYSDSLADAGIYRSYDTTGKIEINAEYRKGSGTVTRLIDGKLVSTPATSRELREAEFDGGAPAWRNFILANLRSDVPVKRKAAAGTYQVFVRFIINEDGSIHDILPETDFGHGMEKEVVRIMKLSPKWIPANLYGVPVKAYRRQPVTFVVVED